MIHLFISWLNSCQLVCFALSFCCGICSFWCLMSKCTSLLLPAGVSVRDQDVFLSRSGDFGVKCPHLLVIVHDGTDDSIHFNPSECVFVVTVTNGEQLFTPDQRSQTSARSSSPLALFIIIFNNQWIFSFKDLNKHLGLTDDHFSTAFILKWCDFYIGVNPVQSIGLLRVWDKPAEEEFSANQTGSSILALVWRRCLWLYSSYCIVTCETESELSLM